MLTVGGSSAPKSARVLDQPRWALAFISVRSGGSTKRCVFLRSKTPACRFWDKEPSLVIQLRFTVRTLLSSRGRIYTAVHTGGSGEDSHQPAGTDTEVSNLMDAGAKGKPVYTSRSL